MDWFDSAQEILTKWKTRDAARKAAAEEFAKKFTPRARRALNLAFKEAERLNHNFIGTEHVLVGLVGLKDEGVAVKVLKDLGLNLEAARREVEKRFGIGPEQLKLGFLPFTPRMKKVLQEARKQAKALDHTYVGTEHLLLGLLSESEGVAAQIFKHFNIDSEQMGKELLKEIAP
ncbi:MAG TPA: Clp protease N-terminal domain-containing protein [Candidatus Angelobacter sp.]|nr:Clp protease N-terminal domain-containing protein [Candidatus Angelobacter sp.]